MAALAVWLCLAFLSLCPSRGDDAQVSNRCNLPFDEGFIPVAMAPTDRFYFNNETLQCTPFLYYGNPPDDANNFASLGQCQSLCQPQADSADTNNLASIDAPEQQFPQPAQLPGDVDCAAAEDAGRCAPGEPLRSLPATAYRFDAARHRCLAFAHGGCSATHNGNRFATMDACESACLPSDGPTCWGGWTNALAAADAAFSTDCDATRCPAGFVCKRAFAGVTCCNATTEALYDQIFSETCPNGHRAYRIHNGQYWQPYNGASCDALTCPSDYECTQLNELFAACCSTTQDEPSGGVFVCPVGEPLRENGQAKACRNESDCDGLANAFCFDAEDVVGLTNGRCCPAPPLSESPFELSAAAECSAGERARLRNCSRPLFALIKDLRNSENARFPLIANDAWLTEACDAYVQYSQCIGADTAKNNGDDAPCLDRRHIILKAALQPLCTPDALATVRAANSCLATQQDRSEIVTCARRFNGHMFELLYPIDGQLACPLLHESFACVFELLDRCSSAAGAHGRRYAAGLRLAVYAHSADDCPSSGGGSCPAELARQFWTCLDGLDAALTVRELTSLSVAEAVGDAERLLGQLLDSCGSYDAFRLCVDNVTATEPRCQPPRWQAVARSTLGFACSADSLLRWALHGDCFRDALNRTEVRWCTASVGRFAESAQGRGDECRVANMLWACVERPLALVCEEDAAEFLRSNFQRLVSAAAPRCTLKASASSTTEAPITDPMPADSPSLACKHRRDSALSGRAIDGHVPQCEPSGANYLAVQCHARTAECWCVDESSGVEMDGTRTAPGSTPVCGACHARRAKALASGERDPPQCRSNGRFYPVQCGATSGACWCADELTGAAIGGTRVGPGSPVPTCGVAEFTCARLPRRERCDGSQLPPQWVFRWYGDGQSCKAYRHLYCAGEPRRPPMPFRRRADCERHCLPTR